MSQQLFIISPQDILSVGCLGDRTFDPPLLKPTILFQTRSPPASLWTHLFWELKCKTCLDLHVSRTSTRRFSSCRFCEIIELCSLLVAPQTTFRALIQREEESTFLPLSGYASHIENKPIMSLYSFVCTCSFNVCSVSFSTCYIKFIPSSQPSDISTLSDDCVWHSCTV